MMTAIPFINSILIKCTQIFKDMEKNYKVTVQAMVYITYDISAIDENSAVRKAEFLFNDDKKDFVISSNDITICDGNVIEIFEPEEQ